MKMGLIFVVTGIATVVAGCHGRVAEPPLFSVGRTNCVPPSVVQPVSVRFAWRKTEADQQHGNVYFVDGKSIGGFESLKRYLSQLPSGSTLRSEMDYFEPVGQPRDLNYPDEPGLREFCRERGIRIAAPLSK
jgi:hypothetical protein